MNIEQAIARGIDLMGLDVADKAVGRLAAYVALLARWNRTYNLTAVRRPEDMVVRHILDSLSILPWLQGPRVLDVGSGAGLPGIPLAIVRPEWDFYLLDSNGKRTRFLTQAITELGLTHSQVLRCRVEDYRPEMGFDSVLSRAFASLTKMVMMAGRLCAPDGRLLAMKGVYPKDELVDLPSGYTVVGIYPLNVPGLPAERHLVHLIPTDRMAGEHPPRQVSGAVTTA